MAPNIARRAFANIDSHGLTSSRRCVGVAGARRRPRYGRPLHPTGDGHPGLRNFGAGGRWRADRRAAKALRTVRLNRDASSSSCGVRSPCRLAGIPARKSRCTPVPHSGRGNTWDKRHLVQPDTADKCERVWQAAGPEVAWRAHPRPPAQSAFPAARSLPVRPPQTMKQHPQEAQLFPLS